MEVLKCSGSVVTMDGWRIFAETIQVDKSLPGRGSWDTGVYLGKYDF